MRELLSAVLVFIAIAVAAMIGGAMIDKTQNVTLTIAPGSTLITSLYTSLSTALTTLTSMLPIVALAIVGGIALFYVLGFLGGSRSGNV
jgi:hypothetical protein